MKFREHLKFREHRFSLADSLETQVEITDLDDLLRHLRTIVEPWPTVPPINEKTVHIKPYYDDDQIVTLDDYGVLGFLTK